MNYYHITLLSLILFISSCANVEKLVDQGNYDAALDIATRKLAGKKNKKTIYVQAAEEAFAKVTNRDMRRIEQLRVRNGVQDWEKILGIANNIIHRQNKLQPLLPLLDKEGYHASFSFVKAEVIRNEAQSTLAQAYMQHGMDALLQGREHNKPAARKAYAYFNKVLKYRPNDTYANELKSESEDLGITHILVNVVNKTNQLFPQPLYEELRTFQNTGRQSKWNHFHTNIFDAPHVDFISKLIIKDIHVSPEQVHETIHHFYRQIDEVQYARDRKGRVLKDSLGNKIEILVPRDVHAKVFEINQTKEVIVNMTVEMFDHTGTQLIRRENMQAVSNFNNSACRIRGDRRAVDGKWLNLGEPLPFPSNESLILTAAEELKNRMTDYIINFQFERV